MSEAESRHGVLSLETMDIALDNDQAVTDDPAQKVAELHRFFKVVGPGDQNFS
jgi:hypothetical protein